MIQWEKELKTPELTQHFLPVLLHHSIAAVLSHKALARTKIEELKILGGGDMTNCRLWSHFHSWPPSACHPIYSPNPQVKNLKTVIQRI